MFLKIKTKPYKTWILIPKTSGPDITHNKRKVKESEKELMYNELNLQKLLEIQSE